MDYIEISGFKSIQNERIDLKPINLLIGANGSGKSNFISFFDFLNRLYNRNLHEYIALTGGENKILHKGQKVTDRIAFKVEFENGLNGYFVELKLGTSGFVFTDERLLFRSDSGISIGRSEREARIKITDHFRAKYVIKYLNGFRKYHFHNTSDKSPFTIPSHTENDIFYLYSNGANLAAFLYSIKQHAKIVYNRIVKTIQSIAPYFLDFELIPNNEDYIKLQWKDKFSDIIYGVSDLSDGTIRFIALTVLFMQPDLPDTIIIDEPELGLHPTAISKLAGMIKSVSTKGCQVIIATQSTDLISHFSPESIITVDQIDGCSKFNRLNVDNFNEWLEDYTIDDLWKRNIIATGQPNFK
ncbi:AAA family ATPase [Roseimarinus sediminis]|uniref:AAA family ATPase n=1 Tax=Roseimarinus sediminis TaxID=1610899 RepID=UPI003D1A58D0